MPQYMNVFLLPADLCNDIERTMNAFWWRGHAFKVKGIRWKTRGDLCSPKSKGGIGFRKLREFNIAMFGKQVWRMLRNPNSLVVGNILRVT
ncbi:unnamed protein product [Cuscuta epithymum]|nr:unnamed protein product [Cuscuta epithymum]